MEPNPFRTETFIEREQRLKELRNIESYKKHKQTCLKNRSKRKHKNAKKELK